jgi:PAS domain S-box-containing protein
VRIAVIASGVAGLGDHPAVEWISSYPWNDNPENRGVLIMSIPLRTLVLEDELDDFKLLMHELRRAGFDPAGKHVDNAEDFLAHLDPRLDIIFSDFTMPGFNGLEALRIMKKHKFEIPFIFVSGTMGEEVAVAAMQEGAADYLMKDRLARLGPAVKKILAQWKLKEEKQVAEQAAARLASIVESSSDAIIATTLEGIVVTWNAAAERLYGYSSAEIVGKDISLLVPAGRRQNDIPENHQNMAQQLRSGEPVEAYETIRVRKDGRRVDVEVSISPIRDAAGGVLGASFIAHDITLRKRAERFLTAEHAVTRILSVSRTLEEACENLLQALADSLRWEAAVLWKVDNTANVLRRVHTWQAPWAEDDFVKHLQQQEILEPDRGIAGRAWVSGKPVWEPLSTGGPGGAVRLRAAISIPMSLEGHMVGAIEFYNPEPRQPDAAMLASLANIASQISQFSERRHSESALRASEERFRTLTAATAAIVWGTPASGEFGTEQPEWTAFTGQTFEQLRGWGWLNAVHPEDRDNTARVWLSAWKQRTIYQVEHRLHRADGEYRHMSVRAVPILERGGAVREWAGVHTDVTEQKLAEEAQARLAALVDSSEDAILCADIDGGVQTFNPAAEKLFGYSAAEAIGRSGFLVPSHLIDEVREFDERIRLGQHVPSFETVRLRKGGEPIHVSITLSPVKIGGRVVAKSAIYRDITERKRAEAEQALLAAVVDSSEDAIICMDLDRNVQSWNRAATRLFGYSAEEVVGRSGFLLPAHLVTEGVEACRRVARGESVAPFETERLRKGGELVHVSITLSAVKSSGQINAISAIFRDITAQKLAENALQESEERYRILAENVPGGVYTCTADGTCDYHNKWWCDYTGKSMEELLGIGWAQTLHPDHRQWLPEFWFECVRSGRTFNYEGRFLGADGIYRWFMVHAVPVKDQQGRISKWFGTCTDIEDRKQAEALLHASEARFKALIEKSHDAVALLDANGAFTYVTPALLRMSGWAAHQFLGKIYYAWKHPDDVDLAADRHAALLRQPGASFTGQTRLRHKDGTYFWVEATVTNLLAEPNVKALVVNIRDITERYLADQALRASEERFRAFMDHCPAVADIKDEQGRLVYVNAAWRRQFAQEPTDWQGKTNYDFWTREAADIFRASDQQCLAGNVPIEFEETGITASGEKRTMLVMKVPFLDGGLRRVGGMAWDITDRVRAEEALRLRDRAIQAVTQGLLITDAGQADNPIIYVSSGFERITGYKRNEVLGRSCRFLQGQDTELAAVATLRAAIRAGEACSIELLNYRKDGTPFWNYLSVSPVLDPRGKVTHFVGVQTDVTERRQMENQFREVRLRLQHVVSTSPAVLFTLAIADNQALSFSWISDNLLGILGHTAEAGLKPEWWLENLHPDDRDRIILEAATVLFNRDCLNHEFRFRHGDGNFRWTRSDMRVIRNEAGHAIEVVGAWSDITAERQLEDQFRQSQLRLQHVVSLSPAVLFTLAFADNRIQNVSWISDNLLDVLGHTPESSMAADWWLENIHPEDRDRTVQKTRAELHAKGFTSHEHRFRHGNGSYRWTRAALRLIRDEQGRPMEVVGAWSDITEHKQLEDQFNQSQKMEAFGQLAGGVAHDFNNLLSVVIGYGELALRALPQDHKVRGFITDIIHAAERSASLTRQLLAFSRKQVIVLKVHDVNAIVSDTKKMLERIIGEDIELVTVLPDEAGAVRADAGQLEQVLLNLAVNARDAMPKGGKLVIETKNVQLEEGFVKAHLNVKAGPYVMLAVSDSGCGMTEEVKARIFEPFFTTKAVGEGTGLGLATVYGIVKQAEGYIDVHSEVNFGTSFKIYLPRVNKAEKSDSEESRLSPPPQGKESILLIEDEAGLRGMLHEALMNSGYAVAVAANGKEAIQLAKSSSAYDLIVTDVVMPGLSGRETVEQLVALYPKVKVLYMSGYTDDAVVRHGILHSQMPFLQKPFSPSALAWKVREVLDS